MFTQVDNFRLTSYVARLQQKCIRFVEKLDCSQVRTIFIVVYNNFPHNWSIGDVDVSQTVIKVAGNARAIAITENKVMAVGVFSLAYADYVLGKWNFVRWRIFNRLASRGEVPWKLCSQLEFGLSTKFVLGSNHGSPSHIKKSFFFFTWLFYRLWCSRDSRSQSK